VAEKKEHEHKEHHAKKDDVVEINFGKYLSGMRKNPWIVATIVLAIFLIVVLATGGSGGKATTVTADEAGARVISFINSNPNAQGEASLVSAEQDGQFYQVVVDYQGQEIPVFATLDGEFLVTNPVPLSDDVAAGTDTGDTGNPTPAPTPNVVKSDKPVVELFVMSHCPYGTQIEKGFLPVADLLGDKIDWEVKFVYYAMHGKKEIDEQANQYCIQKEQNDKFVDYLTCFLEEGDGEGCLVEAGVDVNKMESCVEGANTEFNLDANFEDQGSWLSGRFPLFDIHKAENEEYGVRGSPTLVINGAEVSAGRDPNSLKNAICAGFNEPPAECDQELTSTSPGPGFGWDSVGATAADCGV
jgi:hypothetical protein